MHLKSEAKRSNKYFLWITIIIRFITAWACVKLHATLDDNLSYVEVWWSTIHLHIEHTQLQISFNLFVTLYVWYRTNERAKKEAYLPVSILPVCWPLLSTWNPADQRERKVANHLSVDFLQTPSLWIICLEHGMCLNGDKKQWGFFEKIKIILFVVNNWGVDQNKHLYKKMSDYHGG